MKCKNIIQQLLCFLFIGIVLTGDAWGRDEEVTANPEALERTLKAAFDAVPNDPTALAAYVRFLNRWERTAESEVLLSKQGGGANGLLSLLRAETAWARGDSETAKGHIQAIPDAPRKIWIEGRELLVEMNALEGQATSCAEECQRLLEADPLNKTARFYQIQKALQHGEYDAALEKIKLTETIWPDDIVFAEYRAQVLDAQGKENEAKQLRRSFVERINANPPRTVRGLLAAAAAMRAIQAPRAALQCLELTQKHDPGDPYGLLEKIRLFRVTSQTTIALTTAKRLAGKLPRCGMAYYEFAETLRAMKYEATEVELLYRKALALNPELLAARSQLAFYALITNDSSRAAEWLAENRRINPNDLETQNLQQAMGILGNAQSSQTLELVSGRLAETLGNLYAARRDFPASRDWFQRAMTADNTNVAYCKGTGYASLYCGDMEASLKCLNSAFQTDRYDIAVKNTLEFLDSRKATLETTKGRITILSNRDDWGCAQYALYLAQGYLDREERRFGVKSTEALRIQLCSAKEDLSVLSLGIPACTSCGGPAGPDGMLCFGRTLFIITPEGTGKKDQTFRFDETLHRGVCEWVVQQYAGSKAPLWMVEGMTRATGMQCNPEWIPANLGKLLEWLQAGNSFSLPDLGKAMLGNTNRLARPYCALVFDVWREAFGEEKQIRLFALLREGKAWNDALESAFGKKIAELDAMTKQAIQNRYKALKPDPALFMDPTVLLTEGNLDTDAVLQKSLVYLRSARYDDALNNVKPILETETPSARAFLLAGRACMAKRDAATARKYLEKGLALDQALESGAATVLDYAALGEALKAQGEQDAAIDAFQKAVACNPYDDADQSVSAQLIELLGAKNPKPSAYYAVLETWMPVRRADALARLELAHWYEKKGDLARSLVWYRSAAGIQPAWADVQEALAPLALKNGAAEEAYHAYKALWLARPKDVRVREALLACAKTLHEEKAAAEFLEKAAKQSNDGPSAP